MKATNLFVILAIIFFVSGTLIFQVSGAPPPSPEYSSYEALGKGYDDDYDSEFQPQFRLVDTSEVMTKDLFIALIRQQTIKFLSQPVCKWNSANNICEKHPDALIQLFNQTYNEFAYMLSCEYAMTISTCMNIPKNACIWDSGSCQVSTHFLTNTISQCSFLKNRLCKQELQNITTDHQQIDKNYLQSQNFCDQNLNSSIIQKNLSKNHNITCGLIEDVVDCGETNQMSYLFEGLYFFCIDTYYDPTYLLRNIEYTIGDLFLHPNLQKQYNLDPSYVESRLGISDGNFQLYEKCNLLDNNYCDISVKYVPPPPPPPSPPSPPPSPPPPPRIQQKKKSIISSDKSKNCNQYVSQRQSEDVLQYVLCGFLFILPVISFVCIIYYLAFCRGNGRPRPRNSFNEVRTTTTTIGEGSRNHHQTSSSIELSRFAVVSHNVPIKGEQNCAICLADIVSTQIFVTLPCMHRFHKSCFEKWFKTKRDVVTCPLCSWKLSDNIPFI